MAEEEDDFEKLLADKKHTEILSELKRLAKAISEDESMDRLLSQHEKTINSLTDSIKKINPTTVDQTVIVKAIEKMTKSLSGELSRIKEQPQLIEWNFEFNRGIGGRIESIKATPKQKN